MSRKYPQKVQHGKLDCGWREGTMVQRPILGEPIEHQRIRKSARDQNKNTVDLIHRSCLMCRHAYRRLVERHFDATSNVGSGPVSNP